MKRNPRRHNLPSAQLKHALFRAAEDALEKNGWRVERAPDARGTSMRRITGTRKNKEVSYTIGIRTSQNGSLAFTRDKTETFWVGLSDADLILVSCVDDFKSPRLAVLHLFEAARLRNTFTKEFAKRKREGEKIKPATGFFIPLYLLPPIDRAKYFGEGSINILNRPEDLVDLTPYLGIGPSDLTSSIKTYRDSYRSLKEWENMLSRSLGEEVHIEIPDRKSRSASRQLGPADPLVLTEGTTKQRLDSLSPVELKRILFRAGIDHLTRNGWHLEKDPEATGTNTRRATRVKNNVHESRLISIRTSKNGKLGYKLNPSGNGWVGLDNVDTVLVVCLDNAKRPRFADINVFSSNRLAGEFSKAAELRDRAGETVKPGATVWLPLYEEQYLSTGIGSIGGIANIKMTQPFPDRPAVPERQRALVDLREYILMPSTDPHPTPPQSNELTTIRAAKRGIALSYDVPESKIKIIIGWSRSRRAR